MFFPTEGDGQPLVTSPVIVFMVWKNLEIYASFQAAHTPVVFHFTQMLHFCSLWKRLKTTAFVKLSRGIEMEQHLRKMS